MTIKNRESGFSAIELMITLFIAVAFFTAGYQVYSLITTDGDNARSQARAVNALNEYLERYKPLSTDICTNSTPVNNQSISVSGLINVTVTVTLSCSSINKLYTTKETVTINYGIPQKTVTNSVFVNTKSNSSSICPTGFIKVPGSKTYNTNDFCVMKYEAKADDNGDGIGDANQNTGSNTWPNNTYPISNTRKLVSSAAGYPVANISQNDALTAASTYVNNCDASCHLITEAEWMTIAQNIASVPSNWSSGTVGSGYIFSGHNDNVPATALTAGSDMDGYANTGQSSPSNQRRSLTLTNGEVIWDFAGNVSEWTSGQSTSGKPGDTPGAYREWNAIPIPGTLQVNPSPSTTGIAGSNNWTSANGVGRLWSNTGDSTLSGFVRGGAYHELAVGGLFTLIINNAPTSSNIAIGLRVCK